MTLWRLSKALETRGNVVTGQLFKTVKVDVSDLTVTTKKEEVRPILKRKQGTSETENV